MLYAFRHTLDWERFLALLVPFDQSWVRAAGAIVNMLSDTIMTTPQGEAKPLHSHSFDAGAAWACLALQAHRMGLYTHGMTGVDFAAARTALSVPERFRVECAIAIGRIGDPASLPDGLRAREVPSMRRPVSDIAFVGSIPADAE